MSISSNMIRSDFYLPVALSPGEPAIYEVYGQLCSKTALIESHTVHVLVHGGGYSHIYWDWPYQPEKYSYVYALTKAGYATFNIDRIGIAKSSHPPVEKVTLQANAYVLHQVNQALKNGKIGGIQFKRIINVGRSFGALVIISAISKYASVDGVIITGLLNVIEPKLDIVAEAIEYFRHPVEKDSRFDGRDIPPGYLTTKPMIRKDLFYNLDVCDPKVIELDEQTKETVTPAELGIDINVFQLQKEIEVPVLIVVGQNDIFFCTPEICASDATVLANELPFFSPKARLETFVLPEAGHNINLHPNAFQWFEAARRWSDRLIGV